MEINVSAEGGGLTTTHLKLQDDGSVSGTKVLVKRTRGQRDVSYD